MMVKRHKNISVEIENLLSSRLGNRLTLVDVAPPRVGEKSLHRLVTLRCRCGAERKVIYHRLLSRKYPIFACLECTALVGFSNPRTPRVMISRESAVRFLSLALEAC
jgi:hypothetical protein